MSLVRFRPEAPYADLAHLVERHLAKVEVAGSSPVIRSKLWVRKISYPQLIWRHSQVVRHGSAKPLSPGSNPGDASKKKSRVSGFFFLYFSLFTLHSSLFSNFPPRLFQRRDKREERKENVAFLPLGEKHYLLFKLKNKRLCDTIKTLIREAVEM